MAEPDFEAALADRETKPTTTGIIRQHEAKEKPRDQVDGGALWLWGRLLDFERDGLLARDLAEVMSTMLPHMRETTIRLAPRVWAWLARIGSDTRDERASKIYAMMTGPTFRERLQAAAAVAGWTRIRRLAIGN
jgi:hypothetical protein